MGARQGTIGAEFNRKLLEHYDLLVSGYHPDLEAFIQRETNRAKPFAP